MIRFAFASGTNAGGNQFRSQMMASMAALLVFLITPNIVLADASAIAYGSGGKWAWATRNTQAEANKVALATCNKTAAGKDCALDSTKAIVRAEGGGKIGIGRSSISEADAKKLAIGSCGNPECKVTYTVSTPGFYSVFKSEPDENGNGNYYLAHQFRDSDEADEKAKAGCEKLTGQKCGLVWSGAISGLYKIASASSPKFAPKPKSAPVSEQKSCRPNTQSIRCSSQCHNGNCVVSYENGCKIRVQVQSKYNPFTSQWEYPSPSC